MVILKTIQFFIDLVSLTMREDEFFHGDNIDRDIQNNTCIICSRAAMSIHSSICTDYVGFAICLTQGAQPVRFETRWPKINAYSVFGRGIFKCSLVINSANIMLEGKGPSIKDVLAEVGGWAAQKGHAIFYIWNLGK